MSIKVEVIENLTPTAPFATLASIGKDPGKAILIQLAKSTGSTRNAGIGNANPIKPSRALTAFY